jgi:hypothetical protein
MTSFYTQYFRITARSRIIRWPAFPRNGRAGATLLPKRCARQQPSTPSAVSCFVSQDLSTVQKSSKTGQIEMASVVIRVDKVRCTPLPSPDWISREKLLCIP